MRWGIVIFCTSIALFSQAPAKAGDGIPWAKVGEWGVFIDASVAGCFMLGSWTQGEIVRIGIDGSKKNGYLMVGNPKWQSLEIGKKYKLKFQFDGEPPWTGMFTARKMGTSTVLQVDFDDSKFMRDFGAKRTLVISYQDRVVTNLPLTNSHPAMQSVFQCQGKVNSVLAGQSDPFSKQEAQSPLDSRKPDDPFAGNGSRRADDPFNSLLNLSENRSECSLGTAA